MALATATRDGDPRRGSSCSAAMTSGASSSSRTTRAARARELEANPHAALVFYWHDLERQVRVEGPVERVSAEESDAYFQSRPAGSRLGAWASHQSEVIPDREMLEARYREPSSAVRRRPDPPPRTLGRIPRRPHDRSSSGRAAQPAARPAAVHPRRRRLAHRAAVAVNPSLCGCCLVRPAAWSPRRLTDAHRWYKLPVRWHLRGGPGGAVKRSGDKAIKNRGTTDAAQADRDGTGADRHAGNCRGDPPDDAAIEKDLKALEGEWTVKSGAGRDVLYKFKGDKLEVTAPSRSYKMTVKIDPTAKPEKTIDFQIDDGPDDAKGKTSKGIYKLEDETTRSSSACDPKASGPTSTSRSASSRSSPSSNARSRRELAKDHARGNGN